MAEQPYKRNIKFSLINVLFGLMVVHMTLCVDMHEED